MKEIKLGNSKVALVDDEDFENLNKYKWYCNASGYASRNELMHKMLLKTEDGLFVDHINGNPLDNRKSNLRIATRYQNQMNRSKHKKASSKYKGVNWVKREKAWRARISINNKRIFLGDFKNEEDAAIAYNNAAIKHYKEFAKLNIIMKGKV